MDRIKNVFVFLVICILSITITGCLSKDKKQETDVSKVKNDMLNNLDNFAMDVTITSETGFADITINMNCRRDNKNKIEYCKTSTLGIVDVEQYIDFNNKIEYSKVTTLISEDDNNGKWNINSYSGDTNTNNAWLGINDYLTNLTVTDKDGGKLYNGTISMKKLSEAISKSDSSSNIKLPSVSNKDTPIEIFINKNGYIEKTYVEFEVLGIKEKVNIVYKDYNSIDNIVIPIKQGS